MAAIESPWTCPTCRVEMSSPYCPRCGEEPLRPPDLSLRSLFAKLFHAATSIDGKVVRTAWKLIREHHS